jgi:sugar phosphate isomerase/epimerase
MRLPNAPVGYEEQAKLAMRLGYSGISGSTEDSYFEFRKALDKVGLAIPETYISLKIDSGVPNYNPLLKELIKDSKDRDLLIALHLHSELYKNNKEKGDVKFAEVLTELADYAAKYNVKLAVYPHFSFYCETFSHTLKLVKLVNRPNLGAVFNLCHFLKVQGPENLEAQLKLGLPYLFMVSLSGSDNGDTQKMDWDRLIQPLGKGSYDPYPIVKLLKDNNYNGKFGLQCYNIKMDCEPALTQSMNTWKAYKKRYSKEKR